MASTTKIMTCILVLEMMEPEEICTASAYAATAAGASWRAKRLVISL